MDFRDIRQMEKEERYREEIRIRAREEHERQKFVKQHSQEQAVINCQNYVAKYGYPHALIRTIKKWFFYGFAFSIFAGYTNAVDRGFWEGFQAFWICWGIAIAIGLYRAGRIRQIIHENSE